MEWFENIIVGIVSFIVGVFGFCQIIGVIRTRHYRVMGTIIFTIVLWTAILGFSFIAVHEWFYDYRIAFYIAMGISLLMSWNTGKNGPEEHDDYNLKLIKKYDSEITQQLEKIDEIDSFIESQKKIFNQAKDNLDDITEDDILKLLNDGEITKEQADESISRIEKLQFIINAVPEAIKNAEKQKQEIMEQLNN